MSGWQSNLLQAVSLCVSSDGEDAVRVALGIAYYVVEEWRNDLRLPN